MNLITTIHKMPRDGVDKYITYGAKTDIKDRKIRKLASRVSLDLWDILIVLK